MKKLILLMLLFASVVFGQIDTTNYVLWKNDIDTEVEFEAKLFAIISAGDLAAYMLRANFADSLNAHYTASDVLTKILTVDGAGSLLDADFLDGQSGAYYLAFGNFTGVPTTLNGFGLLTETNNLISDSLALALLKTNFADSLNAHYTASDVLSKLLGVDGSGSLLDADFLDGQTGSFYLDWVSDSAAIKLRLSHLEDDSTNFKTVYNWYNTNPNIDLDSTNDLTKTDTVSLLVTQKFLTDQNFLDKDVDPYVASESDPMWTGDSSLFFRKQYFPDSILAHTELTLDTEWNTLPKIETVVAKNIIDSTEIDTEAELEAILSDVTNVFTNNDGALNDDDVTLLDVQNALTNDFHNVGGTDDDVPELGDFGNANDLDLNGDVADDSHNHVISNVDDLQTTLNAKLLSTVFVDSFFVYFTPLRILDSLKTVDGTGSGLDADLLDGQSIAYFLASANLDSESELESQIVGVTNFWNNNDFADSSVYWNTAYAHTLLSNNPHGTQASHVGLGNLTNKLQVEVEDSNGVSAGNYITRLFLESNYPSTAVVNGLISDSLVWSRSGANIYYTAGYVGVGTNNPLKPLHVNGESYFAGTLALLSGTLRAGTISNLAGADITISTQTAGKNIILNSAGGNVAIGASTFGTSASKVFAIGSGGTAPTTSPTDVAQIWSEDINAVAGYTGFHLRNEINTASLIVPGVRYRTSTGDPTDLFEGMFIINTVDNNVKIYADGGLRTLVTW